RVHRTGRARTHLAADLHHIFTAYPVGQGEGFLAVRVEYHLSQALTIPNVEKDHPAMIPPTVNPPAESDFLICQRFVQLAAIMGTHHGVVFLWSTNRDLCRRARLAAAGPLG